jgi:hypothetical protein
MPVSASTNLSLTLAHAISHLTRPLVATYSATTIIKLQSLLEANLTALYAPTWSIKEPLRGSSRRCMTLSPACLPPRSIYSACLAAGVQWFDWIAALGGREFDFYVDPGCVAVRYAPAPQSTNPSQMVTIWADHISAPTTAAAAPKPEFKGVANTIIPTHIASGSHSKTLAQQLLEEDRDEDDQLFSMIADQVSAPTWTSPILTQFPASTRSSSPLSSLTYSRCSSRSSNSSSSSYSFASGDSSSAATSVSNSSGAKPEQKQSRRERARQARVFVDTSKTEVTPYDGGKTTVLTGGVMLGGAPKAGKPKYKASSPATTSSNGWRSIRA